MNTVIQVAKRVGMSALLLMGAAALLSGCQQKCQQPPTTGYQYLEDTPWRLVDTNDPSQSFRDLSRTTFLIYQFNNDFTGSVQQVINNDQENTAAVNFIFNADATDKVLVVEYGAGNSSTGGQTQSQSQSSNGPTVNLGTYEYTYSLGTDLKLTDVKTGIYYHFVAFLGVVAPDSNCTF